MATFECKVYKLKIEEHPNADVLELAVVGDYRSIVRKGQFKDDDLGVYIPTSAVVPEWLLRKMGLWDDEKRKGNLAGKDGNRVKEIRLRGQLSEGLVYPVYVDGLSNDWYVAGEHECDREFVDEGTDVTEFLGVTKYEPTIPTHMAGEVFNTHGFTLHYDIENFKRFPDVLNEGEEVTMTEKLHGTWCCMGYHPIIADTPIITSKGLSAKGLAFKLNDANKDNLYVKTFHSLTIENETILERASHHLSLSDTAFYILGEVFGAGVQDLTYGLKQTTFRVFDVFVGDPSNGQYLNDDELDKFCNDVGLQRVPVLYRGPFNKDAMLEYTDGTETASGTEAHIREGVVITPICEYQHIELGRVKLKSVSEAYLLRKGKATEYT